MTLSIESHIRFIQNLDKRKDHYSYWLTEHLRLNGLYWGLTALHLLGHPEALPRDATIEFVFSCLNSDGGFGAAPGHDSHLLHTVSAVQIMTLVNALELLDTRGPGRVVVGMYLAGLQNRVNGAFFGDQWGEEDTRFIYGAFNALTLLGLMRLVDVDKAVEYVASCANFDGGYGVSPGAESHAGQIFTCIGSLAIAKRLDLVDRDTLGQWLSERQIGSGGLNGRPEKLEDVCYSWWVLSSLSMIGKTHWIDRQKLVNFILACQDIDEGGISDRPGDAVDVWHTLFGITGLSLLDYPGLEPVDPMFCLPKQVVQRTLENYN